MNDLQQLTGLDPARGREPTAAEWSRSRATVDRIVAGQDVAASTAARRPATRLRWAGALAAAAAAAVGVVGVVGVVAVPSLLPGAADRAFASWTPVPGSLTGEQVLPQARKCAESGVGDASAPVSPSDVILAEQRGVATLLIQQRGAIVVECLSVDGERFASMALIDGHLPPPPPNGTIDVETRSSYGSGDAQYSNVVGVVDPSVTGVDLVLADGRMIQTSTKDGWWAAWWPGPEGGEADTVEVVVHTATGTTTYRIGDL